MSANPGVEEASQKGLYALPTPMAPPPGSSIEYRPSVASMPSLTSTVSPCSSPASHPHSAMVSQAFEPHLLPTHLPFKTGQLPLLQVVPSSQHWLLFPCLPHGRAPAQSLAHARPPSELPLTPDTMTLSSGYTAGNGLAWEGDSGTSVWPLGFPGTFGFQGPVWQVLWVSPCLGTAFLGTPSTLPPGWNPLGCVSVSDFYPSPGRSLSQQTQTGCGKQYSVIMSPPGGSIP